MKLSLLRGLAAALPLLFLAGCQESAGAGSACTVSISLDNTAGALPFTSAKD